MTEQARIYLCPNCGGPTSETSRRCQFCAAPVATERCARCFHMNVSDSRHCSACGSELGLSAEPQPSTAHCPSCREPLAALVERSGTLYDCAHCAGQFVEHDLLRDRLEQCAALAKAASARPKTELARCEKVAYRPCPLCTALMNRRNFGGASGVIVDVCTAHGIWFDTGELPRVLAFVEAGGLERARARALDAERPPRAGPGLTHVRIGGEDVTLGFSDLAAAASELLEFVRKLVRPR